MKTKLLFILAAGLLLGADDPKKELDKLQGEWSAVSLERDGNKLPDEMLKTVKRSVTGESYTIAFGEMMFKGTFKIDVSKTPKTIDIVREEDKDTPIKGIYELDGDTYKVCYGAPGKDRPTEFSAKEGSGNTMSVWKKAKK